MTTETSKATNGSVTTNGVADPIVHTNGTAVIDLRLHISDPDLYAELSKHEEPERSEFAISAMKIGVIAFRHSPGQIDTQQVHQEGERIINDLDQALGKHQNEVVQQIDNSLKEYFDPTEGKFSERVKGLIEKDGVLEQIIRSQIEGDDSRLAKTLAAHVGLSSPLMRVLDPESSNGLITQLTKSTEETLVTQRDRILNEFSLDNDTSALSRLVKQLKQNHGDVGEALQKRIEEVTAEFSLDKEDSALARMRREFLAGIEKHQETNSAFQNEVTRLLGEMAGKKEESKVGTRQGVDFETDVYESSMSEARKPVISRPIQGTPTEYSETIKKGMWS